MEKKQAREKGTERKKDGYSGKGRLEKFCLFIIKKGTYLILLTPLIISDLFFFPFVVPKTIYFLGLVQIIFAAWLFLAISFQRYRPRFNPLSVAIAFFLVILFLSSVFGVDFFRSFWSTYERMTGLLTWFHLMAFFLVISSVFQGLKKDWFKIFSVSFSVAVLVSLLSLGPRIGIDIDPSPIGGATIGNTSLMATYLLFNVFLALYIFVKSSGLLKIFAGFSFILISLGLLLSGGRAAILAFLGGLVLLFFLYLAFASSKFFLRILGRVCLVGSLIVFLALTFLLFQPNSRVQEKFIEVATSSRLVVWEKAWQGWQERPWLGWGPESFDLVFARHFNPSLFLPEYGGEVWFDRAHNVVFDALVAFGIIGLLAYLGIFASAFYVLWRKYFRERISFWTAGIFSVILISYFIQNLVVFDMISTYLMFFLILGFISALIKPGAVEKSAEPKNRWILALVLVFLFFSFFRFIIQPAIAAHYTAKAFLPQISFEKRISFFEKALEISPLPRQQIRMRLKDLVIITLARTLRNDEFPEKEFPQGFEAGLETAVREMEKEIKQTPMHFCSRLTLGILYSNQGIFYYEQGRDKRAQASFLLAEKTLKQAIELSPTNQLAYWVLSRVKIKQNKPDLAFQYLEKAISLEPRFFYSWKLFIDFALLTKNYDLAKVKIEQAIEFNPVWGPKFEKILQK